jgi:glycosyltransferase involved in cell wall biosynthesis
MIHVALRRLHSQTPVDVVEWPDYQGLFFRRIRGIRDVVRTHGARFLHRRYGLATANPLQEALEVNTLRRVQNWIGVSAWVVSELAQVLGVRPTLHTVISNPVDLETFKPASDQSRSAKLVLFAGRITREKGAHALVKAANDFLPGAPGVRLLLVGLGAPHEVARLCDVVDPKLRTRVTIAHAVPQGYLAYLLRDARVFAMPSMFETFGTAWAEAMASGVPVVGSRLTSGPETVPDGRAGLLADPHDPGDIACAVRRLLADPALRDRMGRAGRAHAEERFGAAKVVASTIEFYERCLAASP